MHFSVVFFPVFSRGKLHPEHAWSLELGKNYHTASWWDNNGNNGQNMIYMNVSLGHLFWAGYNSTTNNKQNSFANETNAVLPVQENLTVWLYFMQQCYLEEEEEAGVDLNQPQRITEESYENELGTGWTRVCFRTGRVKTLHRRAWGLLQRQSMDEELKLCINMCPNYLSIVHKFPFLCAFLPPLPQRCCYKGNHLHWCRLWPQRDCPAMLHTKELYLYKNSWEFSSLSGSSVAGVSGVHFTALLSTQF